MKRNDAGNSRKVSGKQSQRGVGALDRGMEPLEARLLLSTVAPLTAQPVSAGQTAGYTSSTYAAVMGTVTDTNGHVLAGASVALVAVGNSSTTAATATTDASGNYTFSALPGSYVVRAAKAGYMYGYSVAFSVPETIMAPAVQLTAYSTVTGTVTDTNGNVVAGASVGISAAGGTNTAGVGTAMTDANGNYTLSVVPGSYVVKAGKTGYQYGYTAPFTVGQGSAVAPTLQIALNSSVYSSVTGTVTDTGGNVLAGVSVGIYGAGSTSTAAVATATTDAAGHYALSVLPGSYLVRGSKAGYSYAYSAAFTVGSAGAVAPTLQLAAFSVVTGAVTDTSGVALAGVSVSIYVPGNSASAATATTDGSGNYSLSVLPGSYQVRASKTGYLYAYSGTFAVGAGSAVAPTLQLTAYSNVTGTVTDSGGAGLAGVSVGIYTAGSTSSGALATATTDANGHYALNVLPGSYRVLGAKTGYSYAYTANFTVGSGATVAPTLQLTAYSSVTGTVTDTSGNAVAGAAVSISLASSTANAATATTDANGHYALSVLPGSYVVRASKSGYQGAYSAAFTVASGATVAPSLQLTAYSSVTGTVTDTSGNAISGASVSISVAGSTSSTNAGTATTDANGHYTLSVLPGSYRVLAYKTGYQYAYTANFTVGTAATVAPTLQLTAYSSVTGTVTDTTGTALAGASVSIYTAGSTSTTALATATTDANGNYTLSVLAGSYTVRGSKSGYMYASSAAFTVGTGTTVAPTLQLTAYVSVTGAVTDTSGNALAGVAVTLGTTSTGSAVASATTDASGRYTVSVLPGSYMVRGSKSGYQYGYTAAFTVATGATGAPTLQLTAYSTVTGTVTDTSGNVLAGASVSISLAGNSTTAATATTDANGHYSLSVMPGSYLVRSSKSGYQGAYSAAFTVGTGTVVAPTLLMAAYEVVSGTVTDANGAVLAGVSVAIYVPGTTSSATIASATTDANGHYTLSVLAGSYQIRASKTGYNYGYSATFAVSQSNVVVPNILLALYTTTTGK